VADDASQRELAEVKVNFESELEALQRRNNQMIEDKNSLANKFDAEVQNLRESLSGDLSAVNANNKSKIESEIKNFTVFEKECKDSRESRKDESKRLVNEQASQVEKLADDFHDTFKREMRLHHKLAQEKEKISSRYKKEYDMCEEDADNEISEEMQRHQKELLEEQRTTLLLREENGILKTKYDVLMKDLEEQKETIASLHEKEAELNAFIKELEETVLNHEEELSEKEDMIMSKEDEISDYLQKNRGLEDCRVDLSRKVKELKDNLLDPKEQEILSIRSHMNNLNCNLDDQYRINNCNQVALGKLQLRSDSLVKEISTLNRRMKEKKELASRIEHDLQKVYGNIANHKALKASLIPLFRTYVEVQPHDFNSEIDHTDRKDTAFEKRKWIEEKIVKMREMTKKKKDMHAVDMSKLKREHSLLTKELKELHQENKSLCHQKELDDLSLMTDFSNEKLHEENKHSSNFGLVQPNNLSDLVTSEMEEQNKIIADLELKVLQLQQKLPTKNKKSHHCG